MATLEDATGSPQMQSLVAQPCLSQNLFEPASDTQVCWLSWWGFHGGLLQGELQTLQVSPLDCSGNAWPRGLSPGLIGRPPPRTLSFDQSCAACMAQLAHPAAMHTMQHQFHATGWQVI